MVDSQMKINFTCEIFISHVEMKHLHVIYYVEWHVKVS